MDEKDLSLYFEQAMLPIIFEAMSEQLMIPLALAMQDMIISLHADEKINVADLAARLQKSAESCGEEQAPKALLGVLASFCLSLQTGAPSPSVAQTERRNALKLIWTNPNLD